MGNQKQTADKSNAEGSQQAIEEMVVLKSIFTLIISYSGFQNTGRLGKEIML